MARYNQPHDQVLDMTYASEVMGGLRTEAEEASSRGTAVNTNGIGI